jgi:CobQ-like glutamine amidotransferase family enzyme/UDP-N-acetylmuramyl tripeptide synthase
MAARTRQDRAIPKHPGAGAPAGLPRRTRLAAAAGRAVAAWSRRLGAGDGTVIGGRVTLALDPRALARLAAGRQVALVSGTNGKTTTNRLLWLALGGGGRAACNSGGSNLPPGLVAALAEAPAPAPAALEVDEAYLDRVVEATGPAVLAMLNLTRDQLDRISEVRMLAGRWRQAAARAGGQVVANADDPLVCWAASAAARVVWVAAGQPWRADAVGCPACGGRIGFGDGTWACPACGLSRPQPQLWLEGDCLVEAGGGRHPFGLSLPGRFNRANAAVAAACARALGVPLGAALAAMAPATEVSGRYEVLAVAGTPVRLLLAKNPAGWTGMFDLLGEGSGPVVVAINARVADGRDPSWLWDVAFERLRGRLAVASGERASDLAVRLAYAEVEHLRVPHPLQAIEAAGRHRPGGQGPPVDFVGNYTAFQDLRAALRRRGRPRPAAGQEGPRRPPARGGPRPGCSAVRVVVVHPDLLGTYGDGGNALVLAQRLRWRGLEAEVVQAESGSALPESADIYCLGGGEDGPQARSAEALRAEGSLSRAFERGAVVLAVCAGFQIVGLSYPGPDGSELPGVGLLECRTRKGRGRRAVGELVAEAAPGSGLPRLTGYENHAGVTQRGPGVAPLGRVLAGVGNGVGDRAEGALAGRLVGTYMHGPVLARNPALADLLLSWVVGPLDSLDDSEVERLRAERLAAAGGGRRFLAGLRARG